MFIKIKVLKKFQEFCKKIFEKCNYSFIKDYKVIVARVFDNTNTQVSAGRVASVD